MAGFMNYPLGHYRDSGPRPLPARPAVEQHPLHRGRGGPQEGEGCPLPHDGVHGVTHLTQHLRERDGVVKYGCERYGRARRAVRMNE